MLHKGQSWGTLQGLVQYPEACHNSFQQLCGEDWLEDIKQEIKSAHSHLEGNTRGIIWTDLMLLLSTNLPIVLSTGQDNQKPFRPQNRIQHGKWNWRGKSKEFSSDFNLVFSALFLWVTLESYSPFLDQIMLIF